MNKLKLALLALLLVIFLSLTVVRSFAVQSYTVYLPTVQSDGAACVDQFSTREECFR